MSLKIDAQKRTANSVLLCHYLKNQKKPGKKWWHGEFRAQTIRDNAPILGLRQTQLYFQTKNLGLKSHSISFAGSA